MGEVPLLVMTTFINPPPFHVWPTDWVIVAEHPLLPWFPLLLPLPLLLPDEETCTDEVELVETVDAEVEVTVEAVELEVLVEVEVEVEVLLCDPDPELTVVLLPLWHCAAVVHWH